MMVGWNGGWSGWLWTIGGLAFVVGVVLVIVWAIARAGAGRDDEPEQILRQRFARGEIDAAQFEEQRRLIGITRPGTDRDRIGLIGLILIVAGVLAWIVGSAVAPAGWSWGWGPGMMGGALPGAQVGPGSAGFVAGTPAAPRVVRILAGPGDTFTPADVRVAAGETITFEVTTMGPVVHEFKVGPAADVAADSDAAPEIADIGMMQTKALTYTFSGSGPFAFACHEPGHYEAGMRGTITIVS